MVRTRKSPPASTSAAREAGARARFAPKGGAGRAEELPKQMLRFLHRKPGRDEGGMREILSFGGW